MKTTTLNKLPWALERGTVREKGEDNKVCLKRLIGIIRCLVDDITGDLELPDKHFLGLCIKKTWIQGWLTSHYWWKRFFYFWQVSETCIYICWWVYVNVCLYMCKFIKRGNNVHVESTYKVLFLNQYSLLVFHTTLIIRSLCIIREELYFQLSVFTLQEYTPAIAIDITLKMSQTSLNYESKGITC